MVLVHHVPALVTGRARRPERSGQGAQVRHGAQVTPRCRQCREPTGSVHRGEAKGLIVQSGGMRYAVAASSEWIDPDGVRRPSGEVHAWTSGTNQTLCGLALSRSQLARYPHVDWEDIRPESGRHADAVRAGVPALHGRGRFAARSAPTA